MLTFTELKNKATQVYPGALIDSYFDYDYRKLFRRVYFWILMVLFVIMVITDNTQIRGLFFVIFSLASVSVLLECFYLSYYFSKSDVDFDVAALAFFSDENDLTKSFVESNIGHSALLRLGISKKNIENFIESDRKKIHEGIFDIYENKETDYVGIKEYGHAIYKTDSDFAEFLQKYRIDEKTFIGSLAWVDYDEWYLRNIKRWWIRENLSRIQSLGRNWSITNIFNLHKFGNSIFATDVYKDLGEKWRIHTSHIKKIEEILLHDSGANIMLVVSNIELGMEIVASLSKFIATGKTYSDIEDKKLFVINYESIVDDAKDIEKIKENINSIFIDSQKTRDLVLVLPKIAEFLEKIHEIGEDVHQLMIDILKSPKIQMIAIAQTENYYNTIETNIELMHNFEKIEIQEPNPETGITILQKESHFAEIKYGVYFTYQSLVAIAETAEKIKLQSKYTDKIIYILTEVAKNAKSKNIKKITEDDVYEIISISEN